MIDTGLRHKVVLITGANNPYGIGSGAARAFVAQGARVFLHYFRGKTSIVFSRGRGRVPREAFHTRSAALELGQFGITVNVVSLGPVQTGWITPELEKEILPTVPLGRVGKPVGVADVIIFLASEQARWVTAQKIFVGGGMEGKGIQFLGFSARTRLSSQAR